MITREAARLRMQIELIMRDREVNSDLKNQNINNFYNKSYTKNYKAGDWQKQLDTFLIPKLINYQAGNFVKFTGIDEIIEQQAVLENINNSVSNLQQVVVKIGK